MRNALLVVLGVTLSATLAAQSLGTAADEAAIKKNAEARTAAWNKHDGKALAALFAADGDRVTGQGYFSGRAQVEKSYADRFQTVNKNASLKIDSEKLHFLTADTAVDDRDVTITGGTNGTVKNHVADIFVKRNGQWTLVMSRVTTLQ
jgi:uncharacterized protein (TIGR02246 family)